VSFADPMTPDSGHDVGARARGWLLTMLRRVTLRLRPTGPGNGPEAFQLRFLVGASLLGIAVGVLSLPASLYTHQHTTTSLIAGFVALLVAQLAAVRFGAAVERVAWDGAGDGVALPRGGLAHDAHAGARAARLAAADPAGGAGPRRAAAPTTPRCARRR
jgi:hypothetical protein